VTALQAQATPSDGRYTALNLRQVPKVPTLASAAAAPPVKLPASDLSAAVVKVVGLAHLAVSTPEASLPCVYNSREKLVRFGSTQPGRALLVRARACCGQIFNFEKKLCQNVRHILEAFLRFYASKTLILK
jgi:hypothetical protein